ncbi:MAG: 50S ribosomal protein L18 [Gammaproteobacteria bacterium]|nr:50S ribosomal protein L18 [Gammaproteobacteria bacterium]
MSARTNSRLRRARRTRMKIRELGALRLTVHRTPRHMYAQIIRGGGGQGGDERTADRSDRVVASASTLDKSMREAATGNVDAAAKVGRLIAERALAAGVETVAFDRAGYKYHGRVRALAEAAREGGLRF